MSSWPTADAVFAQGGTLERGLPGYEPRAQQSEMAREVEAAFRSGGRLVIEAGTGTGKTLAYLAPALLSGRRTIVSTATRNLQEQIFHKDIPLLRSLLPVPFDAVYLKGRQNYACRWKWEHFRHKPRFRRPADRDLWPQLDAWYDSTVSGDRAEVAQMPDDWPTWAELSMDGAACIGKTCPHHADCFVFRARRDAANAQLVIVNHHLFFADLALRNSGRATLLPDFDALIFDEAHNIEETVASFFGHQVSSWRVADLTGDVQRDLDREGTLTVPVRDAAYLTRTHSERFFDVIRNAAGDAPGRIDLSSLLDGRAGSGIRAAWSALEEAFSKLRGAIASRGTSSEIGQRLRERTSEISADLRILLERSLPAHAWMAECRGRGVFLQGLPVDVAGILRALLFDTCPTQIFTSATLTTDGDFRFFRERAGIPEQTRERLLPPVFDYARQSVLFVPSGLPEPSDPSFLDRALPVLQALVELCDGGAFLLFTSWSQMNRARALLTPRLRRRTLAQGDMGRHALLDEFRREGSAVLFATHSFWEGVDVQGEALSLVVIDRLPFASPGDPMLRARTALVEERGGNGFRDYQVPAAAIALRQGFGRLIRHREDNGIVALLDPRIVQKGYGRRFLDSLPPVPLLREFEEVRNWWNERRGRAGSDMPASATPRLPDPSPHSRGGEAPTAPPPSRLVHGT